MDASLFYRSRYFKRLNNKVTFIIFLSIFITQLVNFFIFVIMPIPDVKVYKQDWLSATLPADMRIVFKAPVDQRNRIISGLKNLEFLDIEWSASKPITPRNSQLLPEIIRLEKSLQQQLHHDDMKVFAFNTDLKGLNREDKLIFIPPNWKENNPIKSKGFNEDPIDIQGYFKIIVQGPDKSWLIISSKNDDNMFLQILPLIAGFVLSALILRTLSSVISSQTFRRLDHMASAAERAGIERSSQFIEEKGLGEFAPVARSLNEMQARIQRFIDERTRMIASISHDLRTPLTRMKIDSEFIKNRTQKQVFISNIDHMQKLIEATLLFAQNDFHSRVHQKIDIATLLISLCDEWVDKGQNVSYAGPDHYIFSCRPEMMQRVFENLFENSVKFGSCVSIVPCISIVLSILKTEINVKIIDNGPGIPPEQIENVLKPFFRVDTTQNQALGGFGLGLSIANDIVISHGGLLSLKNNSPSGLVVSISLPFVTN